LLQISVFLEVLPLKSGPIGKKCITGVHHLGLSAVALGSSVRLGWGGCQVLDDAFWHERGAGPCEHAVV
jgi:hypothetical protein